MKLISLKELQKRALNLLCEFDKVCRANGIKYSLAYGTLLGAIRHKGFIPWDDDVDVMLPRPEYDKFLTISKQNPKLFSDDFFLEENEGKSADPVLRLHDKKVNVVEKEYNVTRKLYIDIFPIDGMPNSEKATIKLFAKLRRCRIVIVFGIIYSLNRFFQQLGDRGR